MILAFRPKNDFRAAVLMLWKVLHFARVWLCLGAIATLGVLRTWSSFPGRFCILQGFGFAWMFLLAVEFYSRGLHFAAGSALLQGFGFVWMVLLPGPWSPCCGRFCILEFSNFARV